MRRHGRVVRAGVVASPRARVSEADVPLANLLTRRVSPWSARQRRSARFAASPRTAFHEGASNASPRPLSDKRCRGRCAGSKTTMSRLVAGIRHPLSREFHRATRPRRRGRMRRMSRLARQRAHGLEMPVHDPVRSARCAGGAARRPCPAEATPGDIVTLATLGPAVHAEPRARAPLPQRWRRRARWMCVAGRLEEVKLVSRRPEICRRNATAGAPCQILCPRPGDRRGITPARALAHRRTDRLFMHRVRRDGPVERPGVRRFSLTSRFCVEHTDAFEE